MSAPDIINDLFRLDGHVALVTGGLGRLGSQYARALSGAGASVALFDVATRTSPVVQRLIDSGAPLSVHLVDATRREAIDREVARVAGLGRDDDLAPEERAGRVAVVRRALP